MCGIGAVIKKNNCLEEIKTILIEQANRGRSSAGVAYLEGDEIKIYKKVLDPREFAENLTFKSKAAICHERMPSVGAVTAENAHPFMSCNGNFALVHNGTILNYGALKLALNEFHEFEGETDSEVLMHFIEEYGEKKGYFNVLANFSTQNILMLFKNKILGTGEFYIVRDSNGIYIFQERTVGEKLFGRSRKVCYEVDGIFEVKINNLKMKFYGEVKRTRPRFLRRIRQTTLKWWEVKEDEYDFGNSI